VPPVWKARPGVFNLPRRWSVTAITAAANLRALHSDLYGETLDVYAYAKAANRNGAYDDYIKTVKTHFSAGPRPKSVAATPTT
jgi:hypothetical protein